jgi:hypothetical protein
MSLEEHRGIAAVAAARASVALARAILSGGLAVRDGIKTLDSLRLSAQELGADRAAQVAHLALRAVESRAEKPDSDMAEAYLAAAERTLAWMD